MSMALQTLASSRISLTTVALGAFLTTLVALVMGDHFAVEAGILKLLTFDGDTMTRWLWVTNACLVVLLPMRLLRDRSIR